MLNTSANGNNSMAMGSLVRGQPYM